MTDHLRFADSVVVARSPEEVYALVSDVTRTGEWSPTCVACWWDEGDGPQAGSSFTGRNVTPERTWETRSRVETAEPGGSSPGSSARARPLELAARALRRGHAAHRDLAPAARGLAFFAARYGADAAAQVEERRRSAHDGIPRSLAAVKAIAESRDAAPSLRGRRPRLAGRLLPPAGPPAARALQRARAS